MKKYFSKPFALIIAQCFGLMLLVYLVSSAVLALQGLFHPENRFVFVATLSVCYLIRIGGIVAAARFLRRKMQPAFTEQAILRKGYFLALLPLTAVSVALDLSGLWYSIFRMKIPEMLHFDPTEWSFFSYTLYDEFFAKYLLSATLLCALFVVAPQLSSKAKAFYPIIAQCFGLMLLVYLVSSAVLSLQIYAPSHSIFSLSIFFLCYFIRIGGIAAIALFLRKKNQELFAQTHTACKTYFIVLLHVTVLSVIFDWSGIWWSWSQVVVPPLLGFDPYEWSIVPCIFYEELFGRFLLSGCLLCALLVFAPKLSHKRSVSASS